MIRISRFITLISVLYCQAVAAEDSLEHSIQQYLTETGLPGLVTLIKQGGETVHYSAVGESNLKQAKPVNKDDIFRLYSMTKPIVAAATLKLVEEGQIDLNDDVRQYIPEFEPFELDGQQKTVTVHQLLTHTAGLGYFGGVTNWIDFQYLLLDPNDRDGSSEELVSDVSGIELKFSPGEKWMYSIASDVQGVLIERVTGMTLQEYLQKEFFQPLEMVDTGFWVPEADHERLVDMYEYEDRELYFVEHGDKSEYLEQPGLQSGGSGLVSTASDYANFLTMLLNHGKYKGRQLLKPETVAMMTRSYTEGLDTWFLPRLYPDSGYGYGVGIKTKASEHRSKGTFYWAGRGGTSFWVDPQRQLVVVAMLQAEDAWIHIDRWLQPTVIDWLEQGDFKSEH